MNIQLLLDACREVINNASSDGCDGDLTVTTQSSIDKLKTIVEQIEADNGK